MFENALTKDLMRRIAVRTFATVVLFYLAFAGVVVVAERTVFPVVGNLIADAVSPWVEASVDSFPSEIREQCQDDIDLMKADIARAYVMDLCYKAEGAEGLSSSDSYRGLYASSEEALAHGGSCADRVLQMDLGSIEELARSASDIDDLISSSEGAAFSNNAGEVVDWPVFAKASVALARQEDFAQARENGMALGTELDFSSLGESALRFEPLVRLAFELRNAGVAGHVGDGVWRLTSDWSESSELDSLYQAAVEGISESGGITSSFGTISEEAGMQRVVFSTVLEDGTVQVQFLGDGSALKRDLSLYNEVRSWKIPVLAVLSLLGVCAILWMGVRRSLGYFDEVLSIAKSVADQGVMPADISKELKPARRVFERISSREEDAKKEAVAIERRKNELVAYLAHDTKTPLTSVVGYLSVLDESPELPDEARRKYVNAALKKACRLNSMIDEFFEIAKFNISTLSVESGWFDPAILCWQVAEELSVMAEGRCVRISVDAEEGGRAYADAGMLSRAVTNVAKNAVAYAYEGTEVRMAVETLGAPDGGGFRISVSNEGREISPEHMQRIFEKFYREDSSRSSERGGAGLGLAIAKEIVEAHDGTISARCLEGVTVFEIEIPGKSDRS